MPLHHSSLLPVLIPILLLLFPPTLCQSPTPLPPCPNRYFRSYLLAFRSCQPHQAQPTPPCTLRRCTFNRPRNSNGFICTESSPSPTPSPSPAPDFSDATFRAALNLSDDRVQAATDGSGTQYRISYNATLAAGGVVSLDAVATFASVTCDESGSVRVRLADGAPMGASVEDMYPEGAILIVSRELYGECALAPPTVFRNETEEEREVRIETDATGDLVRDGFLIIEDVAGTPADAVVRGSATTFFAVFDEARLVVKLVNPVVRDVVSAVVPSWGAENRSVGSRQLTGNLGATFSIGPLQLRLSGNAEFRGEFGSLTVAWDTSGVDIRYGYYGYINQVALTFDVEAFISAGVGREFTVRNLFSVPLYGIPEINFFGNVSTGIFTFPSFKFGFFELPLILRADFSVERRVANIASATYTSSRCEATLFVRGPYNNLNFDSTSRTLSPPSRSFNYRPSFSRDTSVEIVFEVFVGVRPQVVAYLAVFFARLSLEAGVLSEARYDLPASTAFEPLTGGRGNIVGICDECHDLRIVARGRVQNIGFFAGIKVDIGVRIPFTRINVRLRIRRPLTRVNFPGDPTITLPLLTGCFLELIDENGKEVVFQNAQSQCLPCPEEQPRYNPTRQECEADCPEEEPFFNQATETCEPCPPETPMFNEDLDICEALCPGRTRAGNDVPFVRDKSAGEEILRTDYPEKEVLQATEVLPWYV